MKRSKPSAAPKTRPKYSMAQNVWFMLTLAFREHEKKVIVLSLLAAIFSVSNSLVNMLVTPAILSAVENRVPFPELLATILLFVGLLIVCAAGNSYINNNTLYGRIQLRVSVIGKINRKAATTSYPNIGEERFEKLISKAAEATNNNGAATEAIWTSLTNLTINLLGFATYMILLYSLDPLMLVVVVATTLIGYFINKRINGYGYRHREEVAEHNRHIWYILDQVRNGDSAKDIRLFGLKPWLEDVGDKAMAAFDAFHKKAGGVYFWGRVIDLALTFLRNGIAYAYLIDLTLKEGLSASQFLLYFSAVGGFTFWITGIFVDLAAIHQQSLDLSTVRECLEYPEPFRFQADTPLLVDKHATYEIRLEDVSFRYPTGESHILEHINLTLRPGEKLAVVGLNGAGKTTLVKLICGFFDPTEGRVLLNGQDIRELNRRDYYRLFSAVFQDFSLLAHTIAVNIAQDEDNIDMNKVRACADKAGLLERIESLDHGFDTYLNRNVYEEAIMLSGGETQRLMLARALYKDAPVILLDEPTAALDPIAEAEMYQKYNDMTSGRSSIYISHRLASTRFCDRIILLEDKRIVEEGTHAELIARKGRYYDLFEVQSKYYRDEVTHDEEQG